MNRTLRPITLTQDGRAATEQGQPRGSGEGAAVEPEHAAAGSPRRPGPPAGLARAARAGRPRRAAEQAAGPQVARSALHLVRPDPARDQHLGELADPERARAHPDPVLADLP